MCTVTIELFFLAPLLQCTSIDRCLLFMRAKKKKNLFLSVDQNDKKSFSLSGHSHISVSTSPTHASAGLNVTNPSPKPLIHISDPYLCPILHLNAHLTPNHAMPIHISNPTPPPRPLLWFSADQTITLVFRWSDPSTSDPFLFQRSNPRRHYPLHRSPAQLCDWWFFILFGLNWEKRLKTSVGVFFFFFSPAVD